METDNHINYSAADIQKYLDGKMTPLEMHRLEKAALEDPFLADAIEGYRQVDENTWKNPISELKETFAQKNEPAKVVSIKQKNNYWWKAAAAAVLILGIGSTILYQLNKKDIPAIAEVSKENNQDQKVTAGHDSTINANGNASITLNSADTQKVKQGIAAVPGQGTYVVTTNPVASGAFKFSAATTDNAATYKTDSIINPPLIAAAEADKLIEERKQLNEVVVTNSGKIKDGRQGEAKMDDFISPAPATTANGLVNFRNFNATVLAPDGSPLPFANINIRNEGIGTYADSKGYFRLISQDSTLLVDVKSMGYEPVTYKLNSSVAQNKIVLKEASRFYLITDAENAVAKKENAQAKAKSAAPATTIRTPKVYKDSALINAEPADGWDNYNTYVANNLDLDDLVAKNKTQPGEVEITFDVQDNGAITNIQIDPSNCNNCSTEVARRLIQQGPQWKVIKGKTGRVKIRLKF